MDSSRASQLPSQVASSSPVTADSGEASRLLARQQADQDCSGCCQWVAKSSVVFISVTWSLLTGIERAIILPTLWLYLVTEFGQAAGVQYYAATLAAFNISALFSAPLFGWLSQRNVLSTKSFLVLANQAEIVGNVLYFLAPWPWVVFLGRLVAGIGAGAEPPLFGDIVRLTSTQELTGVIATLQLVRQVGLILGPGLAAAMFSLRQQVSTFVINVYNLPGLSMCVLWLIHTGAVVAVYPNFRRELQAQPKAEKFNTDGSGHESNRPSPGVSMATLRPYFKTDTFAMLLVTFASYLNLMALEAVLAPVLDRYFGWNELIISMVYLSASVLSIAVYLLVRLLSDKFSDRILLLLGVYILLGAHFWNFLSLLLVDRSRPELYAALLLLGVAGHVIGAPFAFTMSESLYTKSLPVADTDLAQGVLRSVTAVSILVGPLIGGSLFFLPWLVFLIMTALTAVALLLSLEAYCLLDYNSGDANSGIGITAGATGPCNSG